MPGSQALHVPPPILELGQAQALTDLCRGQAPAHVLLVGKHEDGAAGREQREEAGAGENMRHWLRSLDRQDGWVERQEQEPQ
jgi:hypothetical protein